MVGLQPFQASSVSCRPYPTREKTHALASLSRGCAEFEMPVERHKSPYSDIPSMYDIFVHAGTDSGRCDVLVRTFLKRADVSAAIRSISRFTGLRRGSRGRLTINMWGAFQRLESTVDHQAGSLSRKSVRCSSAGNPCEVQLAVQRELRTMFVPYPADVSLSRLRTFEFYVVGDVNIRAPTR